MVLKGVDGVMMVSTVDMRIDADDDEYSYHSMDVYVSTRMD